MNLRTLHVLCGGINSGKTTFARYLQRGKKNILRLCPEELRYSIGNENDNIFKSIFDMLLQNGDVIIDTRSSNDKINRKFILSVKADKYAYILRREHSECIDVYYDENEIIKSNSFVQPTLQEGFDKIFVVEWERSEPVQYGDIVVSSKPVIKLIDKVTDKTLVVVRPREKTIKYNLTNKRTPLR